MKYEVKSIPQTKHGHTHMVGAYAFKSETEAQNYADAWNAWWSIEPTLPRAPLTADDYAAACATHGVQSHESDLNSYGIQFGEFDPVTHGVKTMIEMRLARARRTTRIDEVKRERATQPATPPKLVVLVACDCGHTVPRDQRMNASLGTSCPDCYDRMSDG
jgi:hypothetical protein